MKKPRTCCGAFLLQERGEAGEEELDLKLKFCLIISKASSLLLENSTIHLCMEPISKSADSMLD